MLRSPHLCSALAVTAALFSAPAFAQVSAPELWAEWQAQSTATGQSLSAQGQNYANGVLTISGLMTEQVTDGTISRGTVDQVVITEQADGTATITISSPYRIRIEATEPSFDQPQLIALEMTFSNLLTTVAGPAGNRTYAYTADLASIYDTEFLDPNGDPANFDLNMTLSGMQATYNVVGSAAANDLAFTSAGSLDAFTFTMTGDDDVTQFNMNLAMSGLDMTSDGDLSGLIMTGNAGIPEGITVDAAASYDNLAFGFAFSEFGESVDFSAANQGGTLAIGILDTAISYALSGERPQVTAIVSEVPFPINVTADSTQVDVTIPMRPGQGQPQDMDILIDYQNLVVGDEVWSMFDPGGAIQRTPASLLLDLSAQVVVLQDLLDPNAPPSFGPPMDPRSVVVDGMRLAFGGAELTGTGNLSMPNGMISPPTGQASLQLSGANALLQSLMAAGLLPQEQAMMAQMMMGMIAVPGAGPDTLTSELQFLADGSIMANGVPLPF